MKCSFKNIIIYALLVTIIMIINGEGNPVDNGQQFSRERRKSLGEIDNTLIDFYSSPEYIDNEYNLPPGRDRKRSRVSGNPRKGTQGQFQTKTAVKRPEVSLTYYPREISRRKEEISLIRQQNFHPANVDINGRRSPKHHLHNARYTKRREARSRTISSPRYSKPPKDQFLQPKFANTQYEMGCVPTSYYTYEPYSKSPRDESLIPGFYMVEIEPELDHDSDIGRKICKIKRRQSACEKFYYLFERRPFKLKFLGQVPSLYENCVSPRPAKLSMKLTMPPFCCIPPDCREVLFCKYFQCTSLGYFPDSRNCNKYFFCDINSNGFVLYHMLCPRDRIFDPILRECRLKDIMAESDVQKCQKETAKLKNNEKMRIKKNDCEDLIKYKVQPKTKFRHERMRKMVNNSPNERWKRRRLYRIPEEEVRERRNTTRQKIRERKMMRQLKEHEMWLYPKYRRMTTDVNVTPQPFTNYTKNYTDAKYCEVSTNTTQTTSNTTTESSMQTSTHTTVTSTGSTTTTTNSSTTQTTIVTVCLPQEGKKETSPPPLHLGSLESDAYQDDMQDYDYDSYYDGDYPENSGEGDCKWLRQGLTEYLDGLKLKKGRKTEKDKDKIKPDDGQSTTPLENGETGNENEEEKDFLKLSDEVTDKTAANDTDRGKRSREKSSIIPSNADQTEPEIVPILPDFEKSYNEEKLRNLDGYPCKKYARYPDKFDNVCYYECEIHPDGNMRIEHKCCPKGEEFSPLYLECVGTEYLKVAHQKRSASEQVKMSKKPSPEPEENYDDEKEFSNEWLDASRTNKVPSEFKSNTKNRLRIFHLQCRRNASSDENEKEIINDPPIQHKQEIRSFKVRTNKNEMTEDPVKTVKDEDDDYDEDDEDEDEEDEGGDDYEHEKSTVEMESSSEKVSSAGMVLQSTTTKVLLDADIHVGRDFEYALKNILGKTNEKEKNLKRNSKDSILIRLSGNQPMRRRKRNFFKGVFSKKTKIAGEYPDKEGIVSMLTLINGLPSEYERDALLQKVERRKMMNSHSFEEKRNAKKLDD